MQDDFILSRDGSFVHIAGEFPQFWKTRFNLYVATYALKNKAGNELAKFNFRTTGLWFLIILGLLSFLVPEYQNKLLNSSFIGLYVLGAVLLWDLITYIVWRIYVISKFRRIVAKISGGNSAFSQEKKQTQAPIKQQEIYNSNQKENLVDKLMLDIERIVVGKSLGACSMGSGMFDDGMMFTVNLNKPTVIKINDDSRFSEIRFISISDNSHWYKDNKQHWLCHLYYTGMTNIYSEEIDSSVVLADRLQNIKHSLKVG